MRAAWAAAGESSIILALVFLVFPGLAVGTLIFLQYIGLLFVGIEALAVE